MMGIFLIASASASDLNESMSLESDTSLDDGAVALAENENNQSDSSFDEGALSAADNDEVIATNYNPQTASEIQTCIDNAQNGDTIVLSGTYKISNTVNVGKSLTFIGMNGATIDGSYNTRLFSVSDDGVIFRNIIFKNGYSSEGSAIYGSCTVMNCTFSNNYAYGGYSTYYNQDSTYGSGGAISGECNVSGCIFTNNSARNGGAMYGGNAINCSFANNSAREFGGAIYRCSAVDCTFKNNSALAGGAVYECDVSNSTFTENMAQVTYGYNYNIVGEPVNRDRIYSGGAMCGGSADNCTFINNSADYGGAIFVNSEVSSLDNCIFINNNASNGGALYYYYDVGKIQNLIFENNSAADLGNEIFINSSTIYTRTDWSLQITNCTFRNCLSEDGWFIGFTNRKNNRNNYLSISQSQFIDCSSTCDGGAIFLENVISCNIDGCYFEGNSAVRGGAIYCDEHIASLNDCHFKNNHAQYGGAIFYQNYNHVVNCSFENNSASKEGNDIFVNESNEISVVNCNFTTHVSNNQCIIGFNKAESLLISNCNFINSSSNYNGGALHLKNIQSCTIYNCYFEGNSADNIGELLFEEDVIGGGAICLENICTAIMSHCTFIKNFAGKGGAIYIIDSNSCLIDNNTFKDNTVSYVLSYGHYGGITGEGGAIFTDNSNVIVNGSYFINNGVVTSGSGGAIMGNVSVFNSTFVKNHAAAIGGAMYGGYAENCTFIENSVYYQGGGAIDGADALKCKFINNTGSDGGAMNKGTAIECYFENNNAYRGGALCSGSAINCSFVNNTARTYGGAVYGKDGVIEGCEFVNCSSVNQGGAIYGNGDLNITGCSFVNCSSDDGSGCLACDESSNLNVSDCIFDVDPEGIDFEYDPTLLVNDLNVVLGKGAVLVANLSDVRGPLSDRTVSFTINDADAYCNRTDASGLAVFNLNEYVDVEGYYNVTVSFAGDEHVNPISAYSNVFINLYSGKLAVNVDGEYYDDVVLNFKLTDSFTNENIYNATVKVEFSNHEVVYLKTDDNGVVAYHVPFAPGRYNATASVVDDNVDVNDVTISDIVINSIDGLMKVTQVDRTNVLNVRVYNPVDGYPYRNINVTLKFNHIDPVYVLTDDEGVAVYNMDFDYGTYSVLASVNKPYTNIAAVSVDDIVIKEDNSYATVTFSSGIVFEYGTFGSIYVTVKGGSIEEENIKVLNHPEARITLVKNVITVSNLNPGMYTLSVVSTPFGDFKAGNGTVSINVRKATAVIKAQKITVALKKGTKWTITLVNSKTGKPIGNMKLTLKVYTGKKFKTVYVTTNSNGVASYQTKGLSKGTHKVVVSAVDSRYDFNTLTSSIKVVKQKALKFKVKKKIAKDGSSLSITVKYKNKPINGVKLKVKVYDGKKLVKTVTLKTKTKGKYKGVAGWGTNKLSVGNHKIVIMPASIQYGGSKSLKMKIKKSAKRYPKWETKI